MASYKPCTHPHPPTITHIHLQSAKKGSHSPTPTHTQPKKVTPSHNQPHPPKKGSPTHLLTPSQNTVALTHTHTKTAHTYSHRTISIQKRPYPLTPAHTQPNKGHTNLNLTVNLWKRKFFIIH